MSRCIGHYAPSLERCDRSTTARTLAGRRRVHSRRRLYSGGGIDADLAARANRAFTDIHRISAARAGRAFADGPRGSAARVGRAFADGPRGSAARAVGRVGAGGGAEATSTRTVIGRSLWRAFHGRWRVSRAARARARARGASVAERRSDDLVQARSGSLRTRAFEGALRAGQEAASEPRRSPRFYRALRAFRGFCAFRDFCAFRGFCGFCAFRGFCGFSTFRGFCGFSTFRGFGALPPKARAVEARSTHTRSLARIELEFEPETEASLLRGGCACGVHSGR